MLEAEGWKAEAALVQRHQVRRRKGLPHAGPRRGPFHQQSHLDPSSAGSIPSSSVSMHVRPQGSVFGLCRGCVDLEHPACEESHRSVPFSRHSVLSPAPWSGSGQRRSLSFQSLEHDGQQCDQFVRDRQCRRSFPRGEDRPCEASFLHELHGHGPKCRALKRATFLKLIQRPNPPAFQA